MGKKKKKPKEPRFFKVEGWWHDSEGESASVKASTSTSPLPTSTSTSTFSSTTHTRAIGYPYNMDEQLELATCDVGLKAMLPNSAWLRGKDFKIPVWMNNVAEIKGVPSRIAPERRTELFYGTLPRTSDERRLIRNRAVIRQIASELHLPYPHPAGQLAYAPSTKKSQAPALDPAPSLAPSLKYVPPQRRYQHDEGEGDVVKNSAPFSKSVKQPLERIRNEEEEAERLKTTVLAPFYERIRADSEEIVQLRQEKSKLQAEVDLHKTELVPVVHQLESPPGDDDLLQITEPRGLKRKASPPSPMQLGDVLNGNNEHTMEGHLAHLANKICHDLGQIIPNETIHLCGLAPLKIMEDRPDEVLELAHTKLHTWPYRQVPTCWRRLYEDASLAKAVQTLRMQAGVLEDRAPKRRRLDSTNDRQQKLEDGWLNDVVRTLDLGISLSGAPGRSATFEAVFQQLENHVDTNSSEGIPSRWSIKAPTRLKTDNPIARAGPAMSFEVFQQHLDSKTTALIIPGTMAHWSASQQWHDPTYFLRQTLGGRRLVPVESGRSYTARNWRQSIMTFDEFLRTFILPEKTLAIGYLAQHDLFAQIPALRADIAIPDYCYTTPPTPSAETLKTAGLAAAPQLTEPMLNIWFGPKGTQTPLHTDPYHNILCQIVGYKYVRLYPPSETPRLYPLGVDDKGINMENTSQVDVSKHVRTKSLYGDGKGYTDLDAINETHKKFPEFQNAEFVEGVLGPGECLYVPCGWWHYVEGLTMGISVSFWWN